MARIPRKPRRWSGKTVVIGDPVPIPTERVRRGPTRIQKFADERWRNPTKAEKELERILKENNGVLSGKFEREWVCGKWILDFFFPANRLGIEVDGGYHSLPSQKKKDIEQCLTVPKYLLISQAQECYFNATAIRFFLEKLRSADLRANRHMQDFKAEFEAKGKNSSSKPSQRITTEVIQSPHIAAKAQITEFTVYHLPRVGFVIYDREAQDGLSGSRIRLWKVPEKRMANFDRNRFRQERVTYEQYIKIKGRSFQKEIDVAVSTYKAWRLQGRATSCVACGSLLDYDYKVCKECGWLECSCGVCGCKYDPKISQILLQMKIASASKLA